MSDEKSYLWVVNNTAFILVTIILVIIHAVMSVLSLRKLIGVRQESENSIKKLKTIFWYLVFPLNIICTLEKFFGWSEEFPVLYPRDSYVKLWK